jgi:hypothetical protein
MLLLLQAALDPMHINLASAMIESMLDPSKERPSKQAMYQSFFIFFFLASQRVVKSSSALARPTNTTAVCNTGNTSGIWGLCTRESRNRSSEPEKHRWSCLRRGFGFGRASPVTGLENHRWQRIVIVLLLDVSTVWRPACVSWLERVERHGGLFSSLRSLTLS